MKKIILFVVLLLILFVGLFIAYDYYKTKTYKPPTLLYKTNTAQCPEEKMQEKNCTGGLQLDSPKCIDISGDVNKICKSNEDCIYTCVPEEKFIDVSFKWRQIQNQKTFFDEYSCPGILGRCSPIPYCTPEIYEKNKVRIFWIF